MVPTVSSVLSSLSQTETFASFLGQEIVNSYQLHGDLPSGADALSSMLALAQLPNGLKCSSSGQALSSFAPQLSCQSNSLASTVGLLSAHLSLATTSSQAASVADQLLLSSQCSTLPASSLNTDSFGLSQQSSSSSPSCNQPGLDTADVAQRIRDILSTFNIGQRLFAKHVLGLSQGTVSELLSKPKHWDKLTEKGRESYRKMHLWASDEHNIRLLKAISPRKGI